MVKVTLISQVSIENLIENVIRNEKIMTKYGVNTYIS